MATHDDVFEVVFVCTGNRARSVLAEALFRTYARDVPALATSAGTLDVGPLPPLQPAVDAGRKLGVDLTAHRARALSDVDLGAADLVVGFEPQHVSAAIVDGHADPARSFLLGELVMLLDDAAPRKGTVDEARALVASADSRRVRYRPNRAAARVRDPLGKSPRTMRRTASDIDRLVRRLATGLFGAPSGARRER